MAIQTRRGALLSAWVILGLLALGGQWIVTGPRDRTVLALALLTISLFGLFWQASRQQER